MRPEARKRRGALERCPMAGSGEVYQSPRAEEEDAIDEEDVGCPFRAFENGMELSPASKRAGGGMQEEKRSPAGDKGPEGDTVAYPRPPASHSRPASAARPMTASTAGKLAQRVRDLESTVAGLERELAVRMGTVMKLSAAERAQRDRADALEAELKMLRGEGGEEGGEKWWQARAWGGIWRSRRRRPRRRIPHLRPGVRPRRGRGPPRRGRGRRPGRVRPGRGHPASTGMRPCPRWPPRADDVFILVSPIHCMYTPAHRSPLWRISREL